MTLRNILYSSVAAIGIVALSGAALTVSVHSARAQNAVAAPAIDNDDIGGVVRAPEGQPEAGAWVIAETTDLPTKFARIVVTDDQGRYVLPDLPARELSGLGARIRARRLAQAAREARSAAQHDVRASRRVKRRPRIIIRRSTGTR